jgi:hypothetical protein
MDKATISNLKICMKSGIRRSSRTYLLHGFGKLPQTMLTRAQRNGIAGAHIASRKCISLPFHCLSRSASNTQTHAVVEIDLDR